MIYAFGAGVVLGLALGVWLTWLVMRPAAAVVTGGPKDPAVVAAVSTAGAPAQLEAAKAEERIDDASDAELDALVADSVRRDNAGK